MFQVNGSPATWTEIKHRVVVAKNQNHKQCYWLEIKTTYFKKKTEIHHHGFYIKKLDQIKTKKQIYFSHYLFPNVFIRLILFVY